MGVDCGEDAMEEGGVVVGGLGARVGFLLGQLCVLRCCVLRQDRGTTGIYTDQGVGSVRSV